MYKKVDTELNFVPREKEILSFWKERKIFEKSVELRKGAEPYTFFDGPPTANGKPHIGHVLTRSIKDIIPRYRLMKGYDVLRKAGWDTHGLPVEIEVEKQLGLDGKEQIEAYGMEPFIKSARNPYGNTRPSGSTCPTGWASGRIWSTPTSPMRTATSSPYGGR